MPVITFPTGDTPRVIAPLKITAYQAEVVLEQEGLYEAVENLINHPDTPARIKISWRRGIDIERDNPMVLFVIEKLGLTETQMDVLFSKALLVKAGVL